MELQQILAEYETRNNTAKQQVAMDFAFRRISWEEMHQRFDELDQDLQDYQNRFISENRIIETVSDDLLPHELRYFNLN